MKDFRFRNDAPLALEGFLGLGKYAGGSSFQLAAASSKKIMTHGVRRASNTMFATRCSVMIQERTGRLNDFSGRAFGTEQQQPFDRFLTHIIRSRSTCTKVG